MLSARLSVVVLALACAGVAAAPAAASLDGAPTVVAAGLDTPWDVVPLSDGRTLVTERPGRIRVIGSDGALRPAPAYSDPTARKFLGLEPHPDHARNGLLYLYVSRPSGSSVVRLKDTGTELALDRVVFPGPIATDGNHDGGRMRFGPDGKLYVTTGDIHDPDLPQDRQSLNGKILRLNDDGSAPLDNPFVGEGGNASFVWSTGHRHPQGLAWDDRGRLWQTEHGPSGEQYDAVKYPGGAGRCCRDELNLIVRGGNYGWPVISGGDTRPGLIAPVAQSGTSVAWAPGGLAFAGDGKLYAPMLRDVHLRQFTLDAGDGVASQQALYRGTFGRLRAASYDPCRAALWFTADGASAAVHRVAVGLEGRPAPGCGGAAAPMAPRSPSPAAAIRARQLRGERRREPTLAPPRAGSPPAAPPRYAGPGSRAWRAAGAWSCAAVASARVASRSGSASAATAASAASRSPLARSRVARPSPCRCVSRRSPGASCAPRPAGR